MKKPKKKAALLLIFLMMLLSVGGLAAFLYYKDNISSTDSDASTAAVQSCQFQAREIANVNGKDTEFIIAYGKYYSFDINNNYISLADSGVNLTDIPRFRDGPCLGKKGDLCKFDTYNIISSGGKQIESITAYGKYYNFDASNGYTPLAGNGASLSSVSHYASGPCLNRPGNSCKFDSRSVSTIGGEQIESITAYGKYFNISLSTFKATSDSDSNLESIARYSQGPCIGIGAGNCRFDARSVSSVNGQQVESIIAYGKYYNYTISSRVQDQGLNGQLLTSVPRYAQGPCTESNTRSTGSKTWAYWWPSVSSPWVYGNQFGGTHWSSYNRGTDYEKLQASVNNMTAFRKPEYLVVFFEPGMMYPLKAAYGTGNLPEGSNNLSSIRDDAVDFTYYDDLFDILAKENIKIIIYPVISAYGGQTQYPFSYYSKAGWFWARPDWGPSGMSADQRISMGYGIADPTTDAMRYPHESQSGTIYDWAEHEAGYLKVDDARHWPLTTDGTENTGIGTWSVYESPDMVFNGFDTVLGNGSLNSHTPIPSLSSQRYRDFMNNTYGQIAVHFKDNRDVSAYYLYQEPSYAHLRENENLKNGSSGNTGAGDSTRYQVDYSKAELDRYNSWRSSTKGLSAVSQIPFPVDSTYKEFKQWNLADFENSLAQTIRSKDPDSKILLSIFQDENLDLSEVNPVLQVQMIQPEMITVEWPESYNKYFTGSEWANFVASLKAVDPNLQTHVSHWSFDTSRDPLLGTGFSELITPAWELTTEGPVGKLYPHWYDSNKCMNSPSCRIRYNR